VYTSCVLRGALCFLNEIFLLIKNKIKAHLRILTSFPRLLCYIVRSTHRSILVKIGSPKIEAVESFHFGIESPSSSLNLASIPRS
jgi:hypothetical protein